jgi:hypothetical protein
MSSGRIFNLTLGPQVTQSNDTTPSITEVFRTWNMSEGQQPTVSQGVSIDQEACLRPLVVALRTATQTVGDVWCSNDSLVGPMLQRELQEDFYWLQSNKAMQIDVADESDIAEKYPAIMGGSTEGMPRLSSLQFACLYKWGVEFAWRECNVKTKVCKVGCAARGRQGAGSPKSLAFYIHSGLRVLCVEDGRHPVFRFDVSEDRYMLLTGIPLAPGEMLSGAVAAAKELHTTENVDKFELCTDTLQMLPVQCMGDAMTSTQAMGLDKLIGAKTDTGWEVISSFGNFGVRIDSKGVACEMIGLSIQQYRCIGDAPAHHMLHDGSGNQYTILTSIFQGKIEFQVELGNDYHIVEVVDATVR